MTAPLNNDEKAALLERAACLLRADPDPTVDRASDLLLADQLVKVAKELRAGLPVPGIDRTVILTELLVLAMEASR